MEPFTPGAIAVLAAAMGHAHRLGHRYLGGEHLLLALASASEPVGSILRGHGVTPERVEQEIIRHIGLGAGAGLLGDRDRDALAAIGIDLDTVRAKVESCFEPDDLTRAGHAVQRKPRRAAPNPRYPRRPRIPARLIRHWHRHRTAAMAPIPLRAATRLWRSDGGAPVLLPFTSSTQQTVQNVRREAEAQHSLRPGVEHVALALLATPTSRCWPSCPRSA
jgi:hypothetical protein